MMITYRCKNCGNEFDGHWKLYPHLMIIDAIKRAMECNKCGNKDYKKNIDHDEPELKRRRGCEDCGKQDETVGETICPYAQDIGNVEIKARLCPNCYHERCQDI